MASTAWTAPRDVLVQELARARGERDAAIARAQALNLQITISRANRTARFEKARADYLAQCEREAIQWAAEAKRLLDTGEVPPDPHAAAHRMTLYRALQEKP